MSIFGRHKKPEEPTASEKKDAALDKLKHRVDERRETAKSHFNEATAGLLRSVAVAIRKQLSKDE